MATPDPVKMGGEAWNLTTDAKLSSTTISNDSTASNSHKSRPSALHLENIVKAGESEKPRESEPPNNAQAPQVNASKYHHSLSLASEQIVGKKLEDLAQLRSPVLREILLRLEEKYKIIPPGTPRSPTDGLWKNPYADFNVAPRWRELQGSHLWDGLLDPIDPILRTEIVRYGEFAQATYDCFDNDPNSQYCGSCRFTKDVFFDRLELDCCGYEVTHFLYATAQLDLPNFFSKSIVNDPWSKDSNWIGYVAVTTSPEEIARLGRRDILIAWRGTVTHFEWIKDLQDYTTPAGFDPRHGKDKVLVESGFLSFYTSSNPNSRYNKTSVRKQVLSAVKELVEKYKDEGELSITVTGHSLGSAMATLCGYDLAESQMNIVSRKPQVPLAWNDQDPSFKSPLPLAPSSNPSEEEEESGKQEDSAGNDDKNAKKGDSAGKEEHSVQMGDSSGKEEKSSKKKDSVGKDFHAPPIPITVFSFAGPRVGNQAFKDRVNELGVAVLRVANIHDLVTKVPGVLFQQLLQIIQKVVSFAPSYKHAGVKFEIDHSKSPFLIFDKDLSHAHNLEGYLHMVDGFHSKSLPFQPTIRDYALVNKRADLLKQEYYIPAKWWQEAFKGLRKDEHGHWLVPPRDVEIFPKTPGSEEPPKKEEGQGSAAFWNNVSIAAQKSGKVVETPKPKEKTPDGDIPKSSSSQGIPSEK